MMMTVSIIRPVAAYFAIHTLNFGLALTWISSLIDLMAVFLPAPIQWQ